jgi:DNA-binding Lrp family transcriptional regulator
MALTQVSETRKGKLSDLDRRMLQILLLSHGKVSSPTLAKQMGIPLTTTQRRRKRLESEYIDMFYVLRIEKLGWRRANLLISIEKGMATKTGKALLGHIAVTRVGRTIGEHTIDLSAEVVFKDNAELLNIIEWVKSTQGVRQVIWTEAVEAIEKNTAVPLEMIDLL